jgi:hypothetical protein
MELEIENDYWAPPYLLRVQYFYPSYFLVVGCELVPTTCLLG